jgi:hypothetical protein
MRIAICALVAAVICSAPQPPTPQATVKQELLAALTAEPNASVRKKVGDTVSELAADLLAKEQWPEVLPALVERVQSGQPQVRGAPRRGNGVGTPPGWGLARGNHAQPAGSGRQGCLQPGVWCGGLGGAGPVPA